jgi:energy-coupling factor transporter ATP-binding protein EcfA2
MIEEFHGILGRDRLLETAYTHFKRGRSVIFTGPPGSGKTSLLLSCAELMSQKKPPSMPMYLPFCNPIKQFITMFVEKLYRRKLLDREMLDQDFDSFMKSVKREHYRHSVSLILKAFKRYPGAFVAIDDLDSLTPVGRSIILELCNSQAVLCASASRKPANLKRVLYQFQEILIPPLSDDHVRRISDSFLDERGLLVEDRKHFVENVVWKAAGSPLALDNILRYFENEPHIRVDDVRKLAQGAGRKETSLEWIFIVYCAFIILLRFVSRATMNKPLYILSSAIVAFLMIFRYMLARGSRQTQ